MKLLPAVDIARRGEPGGARVHPSQAPRVADHWISRGAQGLHVVDLDGAQGQGGNPAVVQLLLRSVRAEVQVGGGLRSEEAVAEVLRWGATRAIVATRAFEDRPWLEDVVRRFPRRIMVALDCQGGRITTHGWTRATGVDPVEFVGGLAELPLAGVVYTDVDREGRGGGMDLAPVRALVMTSRHPVYVAGGLSRREDLVVLQHAGVAGAILGTALYDGTLDLGEAMEAMGGGE